MNDVDLERRLREALRHDAERITPRERRGAILAMTEAGVDADTPRPRWVLPVSAAAGAALVAALTWGVIAGRGPASAPPAGPAGATSTSPGPTPTASQPTGSTTGTTPPPTSTAPTSATPRPGRVALPAYFVGTNGTGRWGLYREFVPTTLPLGAGADDKVRLSLEAAMAVQPLTNVQSYIYPWAGIEVLDVTVTPSRISIELDHGGDRGSWSADQSRLAVQQLVWTAQAAVGKGPIPVRFSVADGSTRLLETHPTSTVYNRPPAQRHYEDLASIWIEAPARGQVLSRSRPVVVKGQACTNEAQVAWQLRRGATVVDDGFTSASIACPGRGTWQVDLGALPAGSYSFRAYEPSMEGSQRLLADTTTTFTVG